MIKEISKETSSILNDPFLESRNLKEELFKNPFSKILVYVKDEYIIAYLYYSDIYERIEINQIEVNTAFRNKGIGSALISYLIQLTNKNITLEVKKDNIPALKLYKKYGFQKIAIRKGYYQGIDGILMERNHINK